MTLSQASVFTRKAIIIIFALIILGLILKILFNIGYSIYIHCCVPPKQILPDYKFGTALSGPTFPQSPASTSDYSYAIDTVTGNLPKDTPKVMRIYFVPPSSITLLSADRAKTLAQNLGFPNGPQKISDSVEQFTDNNGGTITINIANDNFSYQRIPKGTSTGAVPNPDDTVKLFRQYISNHNLNQEDINNGRTNVVYDGPTINESNTVNVSVWPEDIDKFKIVTPDFSNSLIKATLGKAGAETDRFLKFNYYYWSVDTTTFALYPIKTADEAFTDLKSGKGYISQKPDSNQVSITIVDLGYYESTDPSSYLLPVYIFQGPKFTALVQAIKPVVSISPVISQ